MGRLLLLGLAAGRGRSGPSHILGSGTGDDHVPYDAFIAMSATGLRTLSAFTEQALRNEVDRLVAEHNGGNGLPEAQGRAAARPTDHLIVMVLRNPPRTPPSPPMPVLAAPRGPSQGGPTVAPTEEDSGQT